jgi:predicted DNA-binding ribbon-helix-helix protein
LRDILADLDARFAPGAQLGSEPETSWLRLGKGHFMNSTVTKRSVVIAGRKTSISLEDEFWNGLKAIARHHQRTLSSVVGEIDQKRHGNLSSAIRVYVFGNLCTQLPAGARDTIAPNAINGAFERRETPSL